MASGRHPRPREALVVVDNFERVLDAAPAVGAFLSAGPNIKILLLASVEYVRGSFDDPARLLGCVEHICETTGLTLQRFPRGIRDRTIADLRGRMSEGELEAAWAQGRAMELDQTVRYALPEID